MSILIYDIEIGDVQMVAIRTWQNYLTIGVSGIVGFSLSRTILRIETRIANLLQKYKLVSDAGLANWAGVGVAAVIYLAVIGFGWGKDGWIGDIALGFGAGGLIDTLINAFV